MFKVIWRKAASPSCQPLLQRMDLSDLDLILVHRSLDPHESAPKWHLDLFSHFCTSHSCAQHTRTHTHTHTLSHRPRYVRHRNRPHLCTVCMACATAKNTYVCMYVCMRAFVTRRSYSLSSYSSRDDWL